MQARSGASARRACPSPRRRAPELRRGGHALQRGPQLWRAAQHGIKHGPVLGGVAGLRREVGGAMQRWQGCGQADRQRHEPTHQPPTRAIDAAHLGGKQRLHGQVALRREGKAVCPEEGGLPFSHLARLVGVHAAEACEARGQA